MKTVEWINAVDGWTGWMRAAGHSDHTITMRRGVIFMVANQTPTCAPREVDGALLLNLAAHKKWSNDYRRSVRTAVVQFFDWCITNDHHPGPNPGLSLPTVPESAPRPRPVPDDMWAALLANADPRQELMARLAAEAGLRRSEIARAARQDVIREIDGWALIVHGKGNKQRIVPLTDSLAQAIQSYSSGWSPHGYLFPGPNGHLSPDHVSELVGRVLPHGWSIHKLRHRFASRGFAGTGNIRAVQEALGHASVATTQRYTAVSPRDVRRVSEAAA